MKGGRSLGLAPRIALAFSAAVAAIVLAGIGAVWVRTTQLAGPEMERTLSRAHDLVSRFSEQRLRSLSLITSLLAHDAPFRAYVAEGDPASVLDNLRERQALYGCDRLLIAGREGAVLADTGRPGGAGAVLREGPLATPLRTGGAFSGAWSAGDGTVWLLVSAPLLEAGGGPVGTVAAFEAVDDAWASELRSIVGAEIAVLAGDATVATSLQRTRTTPPDLPHPGAPARVEVHGERFVAQAAGLPGLEPEGGVRVVALLSLDRALADLRRIRNTLMGVGAALLVAAVAAGLALGHRITRPLKDLVAATERVRLGDYASPPAVRSGDEVGVLADAFRSMVAQLRDKQEMDTYLAALAAHAAPAAEPAPTATRGSATLEVLQNRWEIRSRIGQGGMGIVHRAWDRQLREMVALKLLPGSRLGSAAAIERLRTEIRLARRITHRNVVRTHDLVEAGGTYALCMELVEGVSLQAVLARGPVPTAAAMRLGGQLLAGLAAAHAQGIVHRDLKPGNLLLDGSGTLKIADFGLARATTGASTQTEEGAILGTPHYMAPEQARGEAVDARADLYAAGVVLFELLCGRRPFEAEGFAAVLRQHLADPPPRPRDLQPGLPAAIEAVLLRALEKDPDRRFASAAEMAEALATAASQPAEAAR